MAPSKVTFDVNAGTLLAAVRPKGADKNRALCNRRPFPLLQGIVTLGKGNGEGGRRQASHGVTAWVVCIELMTLHGITETLGYSRHVIDLQFHTNQRRSMYEHAV